MRLVFRPFPDSGQWPPLFFFPRGGGGARQYTGQVDRNANHPTQTKGAGGRSAEGRKPSIPQNMALQTPLLAGATAAWHAARIQRRKFCGFARCMVFRRYASMSPKLNSIGASRGEH